jgi:hypothetical protein
MISQAGYVTENVILEKANNNLQSISPNKKQILIGSVALDLYFIYYLFLQGICFLMKSPLLT